MLAGALMLCWSILFLVAGLTSTAVGGDGAASILGTTSEVFFYSFIMLVILELITDAVRNRRLAKLAMSARKMAQRSVPAAPTLARTRPVPLLKEVR